jgi:hypothetical protein
MRVTSHEMQVIKKGKKEKTCPLSASLIMPA